MSTEQTSVEEDEAPLVRPDPAKARAEKIERFKREKAAKDRLRVSDAMGLRDKGRSGWRGEGGGGVAQQ